MQHMKKGKYIGAELASLLHDCQATLRPIDGDPGYVLAQFDCMWMDGAPRRPGTGFDSLIPYCFGWHRFPTSVFQLPVTPGHDVECACMECRPEPHSLDQLRRRF